MIDLDALDSAVIDMLATFPNDPAACKNAEFVGRRLVTLGKLILERAARETPLPFEIPPPGELYSLLTPAAVVAFSEQPNPPAKNERKVRIDVAYRLGRIVEVLARCPNLTSIELARALDMPEDTVRKRYLSRRDLFTYRRDGINGGRYGLTDKARQDFPEEYARGKQEATAPRERVV